MRSDQSSRCFRVGHCQNCETSRTKWIEHFLIGSCIGSSISLAYGCSFVHRDWTSGVEPARACAGQRYFDATFWPVFEFFYLKPPLLLRPGPKSLMKGKFCHSLLFKILSLQRNTRCFLVWISAVSSLLPTRGALDTTSWLFIDRTTSVGTLFKPQRQRKLFRPGYRMFLGRTEPIDASAGRNWPWRALAFVQYFCLSQPLREETRDGWNSDKVFAFSSKCYILNGKFQYFFMAIFLNEWCKSDKQFEKCPILGHTNTYVRLYLDV